MEITYDFLDVLCFTVTLSDCGIFAPEHRGNWTANDIAAAKYDGGCTCERYTSRFQNAKNTSRSARKEERLAGTGR